MHKLKLENDVASEFNRIADSDLEVISKQQPLIVNDIVKQFKKKGKGKFIAVNHLGFGVQPKECFGLLGKLYFKYIKFY